METLAMILAVIGGVILLVGYLWFLGIAFSEGGLWGPLCVLVPVAALLFVLIRPRETWLPATIYVVGAVVLFTGLAMLAPR